MASILLVLAVLGVIVAGVTMWPIVAAAREPKLRPATATVVAQASCGAAAKGDRLEINLDGQTHTGTFDGCGHLMGQKIPVMVPAKVADGFVATPADSSGSELDALANRANIILATLAAVAGGGYAVLLGGRRAHESAEESPLPHSAGPTAG